MTRELFREDGYLKRCDAVVTSVAEGTFCVDQTVFYPVGGGQPGDTGQFQRENGAISNIVDSFKDPDSGHLHVCEVRC